MKKSQLLYSLLIVLFYGCQQKSSSNNNTNDAKNVKQDLQSNYAMKYTDSTMQAYAEKAYTALVNHNYKFPSAADFEQTINDVYHIDVKKAKFDDVDLTDENGPVPIAVRQKNFVYVFDPVSDAGPSVDSTLTFNLNNYLFNKNTGSRNLLLNSNNKQYLFDLVEKYGYANDEYLLKYVLDKKYKNENSFKELGSIIFIKNANGNLEIRTQVLNFIAAHANQNDVVLARNILLYCISLTDNKEDTYFSDAQKAKIIAFAANAIDPIFKKYHRVDNQNWGTASILSYYINTVGEQKWNEAEASYTKEKYYNLPNLAEMIEYAKQFDHIGAPD